MHWTQWVCRRVLFRKLKPQLKDMNQIIFCIFCWADRWYTRLSHRISKLSDVLWSVMAILMVDGGSYGCCSAVFNWIFRYCCQLNLLNRFIFYAGCFSRYVGNSEGINERCMQYMPYSVFYVETQIIRKIYQMKQLFIYRWHEKLAVLTEILEHLFFVLHQQILVHSRC